MGWGGAEGRLPLRSKQASDEGGLVVLVGKVTWLDLKDSGKSPPLAGEWDTGDEVPGGAQDRTLMCTTV